jgi:hypothetical protein
VCNTSGCDQEHAAVGDVLVSLSRCVDRWLRIDRVNKKNKNRMNQNESND